MASLSASITQGCDANGGVLTLIQVAPAPGASANLAYSWTVLNSQNQDFGGGSRSSGGARAPAGGPNFDNDLDDEVPF